MTNRTASIRTSVSDSVYDRTSLLKSNLFGSVILLSEILLTVYSTSLLFTALIN